jgi:hypothetical protein
MHLTGHIKTLSLTLLLLIGISLVNPPVIEAQDTRSEYSAIVDGEPTDPVDALSLLEAEEYENYGFDTTVPEDEDAFIEWFEALLDLLCHLGLILNEESGS